MNTEGGFCFILTIEKNPFLISNGGKIPQTLLLAKNVCQSLEGSIRLQHYDLYTSRLCVPIKSNSSLSYYPSTAAQEGKSVC